MSEEKPLYKVRDEVLCNFQGQLYDAVIMEVITVQELKERFLSLGAPVPNNKENKPEEKSDDRTTARTMDAQVTDRTGDSEPNDNFAYLVHYKRWSPKWDEWVRSNIILPINEESRIRQQQLKEASRTRTPAVRTSLPKKRGRKKKNPESQSRQSEVPESDGNTSETIDDSTIKTPQSAQGEAKDAPVLPVDLNPKKDSEPDKALKASPLDVLVKAAEMSGQLSRPSKTPAVKLKNKVSRPRRLSLKQSSGLVASVQEKSTEKPVEKPKVGRPRKKSQGSSFKKEDSTEVKPESVEAIPAEPIPDTIPKKRASRGRPPKNKPVEALKKQVLPASPDIVHAAKAEDLMKKEGTATPLEVTVKAVTRITYARTATKSSKQRALQMIAVGTAGSIRNEDISPTYPEDDPETVDAKRIKDTNPVPEPEQTMEEKDEGKEMPFSLPAAEQPQAQSEKRTRKSFENEPIVPSPNMLENLSTQANLSENSFEEAGESALEEYVLNRGAQKRKRVFETSVILRQARKRKQVNPTRLRNKQVKIDDYEGIPSDTSEDDSESFPHIPKRQFIEAIELKPAAVPGTNKHGEGPDLKSADSKCANEPTEMLNHSNESEETKETIPSTSANAATMEKIQSGDLKKTEPTVADILRTLMIKLAPALNVHHLLIEAFTLKLGKSFELWYPVYFAEDVISNIETVMQEKSTSNYADVVDFRKLMLFLDWFECEPTVNQKMLDKFPRMSAQKCQEDVKLLLVQCADFFQATRTILDAELCQWRNCSMS